MENNEFGKSEQTVQEPAVLESTPIQNLKPKKVRKFWTFIFPIVMLMLLGSAVGIIVHLRSLNNNGAQNNQTTTDSQNIDLNSVNSESASFKISDSNKVVFNGEVQATQGLILQPTDQPSSPAEGQIYIDSKTNQLRYYNGAKFITVADQDALTKLLNQLVKTIPAGSGSTIAGVDSLQGATGAITLSGGNGLSVSVSGKHITLGLPQNISAAASPTFAGLTLSSALSVGNGGSGNTSFTANGILFGNGASPIGTVVASAGDQCLTSNSGNTGLVFASCPGSGGVASFNGQTGAIIVQGTANQVSVGQSGNTFTLSAPQDINTTSAPTFGGLTINGDTDINGGDLTLNNPGGAVIQTGSGQDLTIQAGSNSNVITLVSNGISFILPTSGGATQTICTTGISCVAGGGQAVLLQPGATPQTNASATDSSIFINNTSTADILQLQSSGVDSFVVDSNGNLSLGLSDGSGTSGTIVLHEQGSSNTVTLQAEAAGVDGVLTLPAETGKLCTSDTSVPSNDPCYDKFASVSGSGNYIQFAPASAQQDNTCIGNPSCTTSTIYVAKTTSAGNILRLQGWCTDAVACATPQLQDALVLQGDGQLYFRSLQSSATAFQIRDSSNNPVVSISTQSSTNLITNPSFESTISPWVAYGCTTSCNGGGLSPPTVSLYNTAAYDGVNSLRIQNTSGAANNKQGVYFPVNLDANSTYAVSFVASEVDTVKVGTVRAGYYVNPTPETQATNLKACGTTMQIVTRVTDDPTSPNWSTFTCTFTTGSSGPGGIGGSGIYITNATASSDYIIDKVIVQKGTTTSSYNGQFNVFTPSAIQTDNESAFLITGSLGQSLKVDTLTSNFTIGLHTYTDSDGNTQFGALKVLDASGKSFVKATTGNAGSLSDWTKNSNQLTTTTSNTQATIVSYGSQNYAYVIGGANSGGPLNAVQHAAINTNGTGTWQNDNNTFPYTVKSQGVVSYRNYIYVLGGTDNSSWYNNVYMNQIKSDGSLSGAWKFAGLDNLTGSAGSHMISPRSDFSAFVYNGYIYAVGGQINSGGTITGNIEYAQIRGDGTLGAWTAVGAGKKLTDANATYTRKNYAVALHNNTVFIIGGSNSGGAVTTVLFDTIGSSGDLNSSWQATTSLPTTRTSATADFYGDYLYVFGGNGPSKTANSYAFASYDVSSGGVGDWAISDIHDGTTSQGLMSIINHGMVRLGNTFFIMPTSSGAAASKNIVYVTAKDSSNALDISGSLSVSSGASLGGSLAVTTSTNSTGALVVSNSSLQEVFKVDTTNSAITLGGLNSPDFNSWTNTGVINNGVTTPYGQEGNTSVIVNGYIYSISGTHGGSGITLVNYAKLNTDGSIRDNSWTATTALPDFKIDAAAVATNGYIYVFGGIDSGGVSGKIYVGHPGSDGTISSWKTLTPASPYAGKLSPAIAVYNGYVYIMGGANSFTAGTPPVPTTPSSSVQFSKLQPDGSLGVFANASASLGTSSNVRMGGRSAVANGFIYFTGGADGTGATSTVYYARPSSTTGDISSWSATSSSPTDNRAYHTTIVANGYLYLVAGTNTTFEAGDTNTIQFGKITSTGDITSWSTGSATLFGATSNQGSAFANGYLYLVGGHNDLAAVQFASSARVSVGGSLDLVGIGSQTLTDAGGGGQLTAGDTTIVGTLDVRDNANFTQSVTIDNALSVNGQVLLQNNVNSVSALAIQNANGTQVAAVDTTNGQLILGSYNSGSNPVNGSLAFANTANANTITLQSPTGINAPSGNVVFTLPKTVGTSGQCLKATDGSGGLGFVDCVGGGGGGGSTAVTTLNGLSGDVILQDSNSRITITTPDSTHINITIPQSVATSATPTFAGETLTGALTQSGGTAQINVSGTSNTSIGNSTGTLQLQSNTFNVSTAGAITGVTGYTQSSGNFSQIGVGSFSTGTGTVSLNGATTVSSTLTVQGSNALTLGLTGTNTGAIVLRGATAASGTLTIQGLSNPSTSNYKISFPTVASDDTFCLLTAQNCAGSGVNLQVAYNGSGATDPQIKVTSANGGVKIQDADTTISGNLFTVKGSSATGANALFNVSSTGNVTIQNTAGSQFFNLDATNALISLNGANPGGLSTSPGWQSATALGTANYANYSVAVRGYLYAIGGVNNSSAVNYAKINADGSIGSWTGTTSLGGNCSNSLGTNAPTTYNGYIYVLCSGSANGYYGRPNADGTVSLWTAFTMPSSSLSLFSSVMVSGYLYVIGGQSGGVSQSAVYYAQINNDGSVGSFASTTALGSPTTAENSTAATVVNGYIYVIGGSTTASGGNVVQNVFYAKPASNGVIPSWAATTQLPAPGLRAAAAIGSNGYIYVLGGSTTSASTSKSTTVYYGKPSSTGTVPSWSTTTALGTAIDGEAVAQYNGYIYTVGGAASSNVAQTGVKYISGERVQIAGSLDLVGLSGSNLADTGGSSGGSLTAGNTNIVGNLNVQGGAGFAQSVAIAGGLGVTGNTYLQNGSGTNLLASDITNNKITIGSPTTYTFASLSLYAATAQITGTTVIGAYVSSTCYDATAGNGYVIFSSTSSNPYEPMLCGTARHTKTISLAPEYAGAVLYPDGSNNSGTMTTGFDGTNFHTYYKWTTSQGTNQDFDIIVRVPVPSGYSSLPTGAQYCVNTYSSDLSNGTITGIMYDSSGNPQSSANLTPTNIGAGGAGPGAWQQVCSNNIGGTITAGGYITFRLKMQSPTSGDVRLGELSFNYMSSF